MLLYLNKKCISRVIHLPKLLGNLAKEDVIVLLEVTPAYLSDLRCQRSTGSGATVLF